MVIGIENSVDNLKSRLDSTEENCMKDWRKSPRMQQRENETQTMKDKEAWRIEREDPKYI